MTKTSKYSVISLLILLGFQLYANDLSNNGMPNILIIIADDCTYNDLPLYGGKNVKTPQIDQLASEGMIFNRAFVTMSMCVPCRAELYTGLQPARNGVCWNHSKARTGTTSIVQYLGKLGYRVGLAGKVHADPREVYPFEMVEGLERNCVAETAGYDSAGLKEFMLRDKNQPFCLVTALVVPHIPWTVGDPSHFDPDKLNLPEYMADTKEMRVEYTKYLAEIEVLDQQIGSTLNLLKEEGMEDNTIVIFTSEQGSQIPGCKWTNWNNGVHTGFIVRWPGKVKEGIRSDAIIQYADVVPTLISAVGGDVPANLDGSSFLPVLLGEKDSHRKYAYYMHNNYPEGPPYPIRSISDGKYHYIRNLKHENLYIEKHLMARMTENQYWPSWVFEATENPKTLFLVNRYMKRPAEELYDVDADPYELVNLIDKDDLQLVKKQLSAELDKWMKTQGDPGATIDSAEEWGNAKKGNHFKNQTK